MASPTSRSTSRRTGDNGLPGYMAKTEASKGKQCPPVANLKRSAPNKTSSTTPQYATKRPVSNSTVSSRTSANTHASEGIATKKPERPTDEAPESTIETTTPRDEVYSTTCSTWSFLQGSPASSLSSSPLPPYEEACVDAPDYERDEGLPLAWSLPGARPESLPKLPTKALTKPGSNRTAKTGERVDKKPKLPTKALTKPGSNRTAKTGERVDKASPPSIPDDLACLILDDMNDIMQSIDINVYDI
ncbi:unnamed protein product [Rhizoctonia solani]|uniref:Uncharacterized protein n=2 Tax=Rhizoctonia solani TaxID=456999 RepID=A0A8H3HER2_9AGAM